MSCMVMCGSLPAYAQGTIESFQKRVDAIAQEHGVPAPNVREVLAQEVVQDTSEAEIEPGEEVQGKEVENWKSKNKLAEMAPAGVPPIEKIVEIRTDSIRAIKNAEGRIMFLIDNGRFGMIGQLVDIWNRKPLTTIEEIEKAINHIDLKRLGVNISELNHISVGTGDKHVTLFVDPQCGWCHRMMGEINAKQKTLFKEYTFDFVLVPVLGERSTRLTKMLYCAKEENQDAKYAALVGGAKNIERLEQKENCDLEGFEKTGMTASAIGLRGVPMVIAHDGRFVRGKPENIELFLEPEGSQKRAVDDLLNAADSLKGATKK